MSVAITWCKDIKDLFTPQDVGCMNAYGATDLDLSKYESVKKHAITIWEHVALGSMPIGADRWPRERCDLFRHWIDQGMLYGDEATPSPIKPVPPINPQPVLRVRKDILSLTDEELMEFREAVEKLEPNKPDSIWAKCANIHGEWCLHYQEAFLLWHRAHLLYVEKLLGVPIPYWNWMAPSASVDGIPKAYTDPIYKARDGTIKPNPLYDALGIDGATRTTRSAKLNDPDYKKFIELYQQQVATANKHTNFSIQQGEMPWANLPDFTPHQDDEDYCKGGDYYDRYMEQPHDNVHGWIGSDMADNAKTAFDPIFYAHHSNIDRLFYNWQVAHPGAQYTVAVPILPFASDNATLLLDPYHPDALPLATTIGDLARDVRKLGYTYQMPSEPENFCVARTALYSIQKNAVLYQTASETIANINKKDNAKLLLRLPGVMCTKQSYTLYFFIYKEEPKKRPTLKEATLSNPHFCCMQHRNGMGKTTNTERCIKTGVIQTIDITQHAQKLEITSSSKLPKIVTVIVETKSSKEVADPIPGARPHLQWVVKKPKHSLVGNVSCCAK